ncbi:MAG TPA: TonB-dependent receptor, partial [Bacteroidales bacterium]|nr:TonB-dependent receptor [Bacteroidales bacterium]
RKPEEDDRLYLNLYGNEEGRLEANVNLAHHFNKRWSSGLLLHGKDNSVKWDRNNDGFLDNPIGNNMIALHRWNYTDSNRLHFQIGVKGTFIDNTGGQTDFRPAEDALTTHRWGMKLSMQRMEGWTKLGRVFEEKPWKTVGLQLAGTSHHQDSYFGLNEYAAKQNTLYANLLYQSIIDNTSHKYRTGASLLYDQYKETLNDTIFTRKEVVPGAFFEYTFNHQNRFNVVAGIRADYHNIYGLFITPRLHLRYLVTEDIILRASGGRGQRTASILSENNGLLSSSRQIIIMGNDNKNPYGLKQEVAWNYGINATVMLDINHRHGNISFDLYRTDFKNQVVVDLDHDPQMAIFYSLKGKSFSNSFQAQIDYELFESMDVRLAYRWFDVQTTYNDKLMQRPLVARHRSFINLAYETNNHWKFDYTLNWQGEKRIPDTRSNPEEYRLSERSPGFILVNAQISKSWRGRFEIYAGVENLLDFKQSRSILSSDQPFGPYFDSTLIWGPVFGRNIYMGIRYRLK